MSTMAADKTQTPATTSGKPLRCITIDVEDYYHIEAAHRYITRDDWPNWPGHVESNTDLLLQTFAEHNLLATFFILGDVARKHPNLARRIADAGHEIASHGTNHDRLHRLNPESFRIDLLASKHLLEDQAGQPVRGYRAPTFSIVPKTGWAVDVIADAGLDYDASIFPTRHPSYGVPNAPTTPFYVRNTPSSDLVLELPPLTWRVLHKNLPVAGGGYFRLLPQTFMKRGLAQAAKQQRPAVLYFHPWEFDTGIPELPLPLKGRIRTYTGIKKSLARLVKLIEQPSQYTTLSQSLDCFHQSAKTQKPYTLNPGMV